MDGNKVNKKERSIGPIEYSHFRENLYKASQADWSTVSSGESSIRMTVCAFFVCRSNGSNWKTIFKYISSSPLILIIKSILQF